MNIPDKPSLEGLEEKWSKLWKSSKIYNFELEQVSAKQDVYSIDTPPPTASGVLHIGHVFSYTHTDIIARFQRMQGKIVFYPMGWDDNGLPTERRVQNYFSVRCDPSLPYCQNLKLAQINNDSIAQSISRRNFIELCQQLSEEDERKFEELWNYLGLSVDWSQTYRTIDDDAIHLSQHFFLKNVNSGTAYQDWAPTLWDVTYRTAVAQAEIEERQITGFYYRLAFENENATVEIETTRPELLAGCVALVAHPDDNRYKHLFGSHVITPVFDVKVPVLPHRAAQPDKGSGIAMVCTFGDITDVQWWRDLNLQSCPIIDASGRVVPDAPDPIVSERGRRAFATLSGKTLSAAKKHTLEMLISEKSIIGEPRKITHPVKFFEKGDKPLEILLTRQWYIRNGYSDNTLTERLIELGKQLQWYPKTMLRRYEDWLTGLNSDWLISRQRFLGVPFPIWYQTDDRGNAKFDDPIFPDRKDLPLDPTIAVPRGYSENQRGAPNGFVAETDVMDTWATSSLTPQLAGKYLKNPKLFEAIFPYSLRPQGQDIIRTWLFSSIIRSEYAHATAPWKSTAISGFILDPDRKKMSKSKGNAKTPKDILDRYGADAVRYWAACARLGVDTALDVENPTQIKIGRRLALKVLNAARFVVHLHKNKETYSGQPDMKRCYPIDFAAISNPLDLSLLKQLDQTIEQSTNALKNFDHSKALDTTETFFWNFCDNYVEIVKDRAYAGDESALTTLLVVTNIVIKLLAPFIPYATEEAWSWFNETSVHTQSWPETLKLHSGDIELLKIACSFMSLVRGGKTEAKLSQKTEIAYLKIALPNPEIIMPIMDDLRRAGKIDKCELIDGDAQILAIEYGEISR